MNKAGNPKTLIASQPGNANAVRNGIHSPRLIQARASEIKTELTQAFELSATQSLVVHEVARCMAILEAIDRDLDERGVVDKGGKPRYLLNHRSRISRQLDQWLAKISEVIERQAADNQQRPPAERADYVRGLQRIALGQDPTANARDRISALKELLKLDSTASGESFGAVTVSLITDPDGNEVSVEKDKDGKLIRFTVRGGGRDLDQGGEGRGREVDRGRHHGGREKQE